MYNGRVTTYKISTISDKDIIANSVFECKTNLLKSNNGPISKKFGASYGNDICETCFNNKEICNGHSGMINLGYYIPNEPKMNYIKNELNKHVPEKLQLNKAYTLFYINSNNKIVNVSDSDIDNLINKYKLHHLNLYLNKYLPVIPTRFRNSTMYDNTAKQHNISSIYQKLISCCINKENKLDIAFGKLNLTNIFNKFINKSDDNFISMSSILSKKTGLYLFNVLTKRVNNSIMTVACSGNEGFIEDVELPKVLLNNNLLCRTEIVTEYNKCKYTSFYNNRYKYIKRISESGYKSEYLYNIHNYTDIKVGDVIGRSFMDGDKMIINRCPSLNKYSFIGSNIKFTDSNAIHVNQALTKRLNLDFDGDCIFGHMLINDTSVLENDYMTGLSNSSVYFNTCKGNLQIDYSYIIAIYKIIKDYKYHIIRKIPFSIFNEKLKTLGFSLKFNKLYVEVCDIINSILPENLGISEYGIKKGKFQRNSFDIIKSYKGMNFLFDTIRCLVDVKYSIKVLNALQFIGNVYVSHVSISLEYENIKFNNCKNVDKIYKNYNNFQYTNFTDYINMTNDITSKCTNIINKYVKNAKDPSLCDILSSSATKVGTNSLIDMYGCSGQVLQEGKLKRINNFIYSKNEDLLSNGFVKSSLLQGSLPGEFYHLASSSLVDIIDKQRETPSNGVVLKSYNLFLRDVVISDDHKFITTSKHLITNCNISCNYEKCYNSKGLRFFTIIDLLQHDFL